MQGRPRANEFPQGLDGYERMVNIFAEKRQGLLGGVGSAGRTDGSRRGGLGRDAARIPTVVAPNPGSEVLLGLFGGLPLPGGR